MKSQYHFAMNRNSVFFTLTIGVCYVLIFQSSQGWVEFYCLCGSRVGYCFSLTSAVFTPKDWIGNKFYHPPFWIFLCVHLFVDFRKDKLILGLGTMMASWILALVAVTLSAANGQNLAKQVCSADKSLLEYSYNNANVIFGVSLSIRNAERGGVGCGKPSGTSMQLLEALKFTINYLNNFNGGQGYLPGITFGMKLYDDCHSPTNALRDLQKLFPQSTTYQPYCSATSNKAMLGLLGPFYSVTALKVGEYAKDIPTTLISPYATSAVLSDTIKYPTFFRTVPSVVLQMRAVAALLSKLQWKKVLVIHSDSNFGISGFEQLVKASKEYDICVSHSVQMPYIGTVDEYRNILQNFGPNDFAGGVISAGDEQARHFLEAIQQVPELQKIHWVLTDVALDNPISSTTLKYMRGAYAVLPFSIPIVQFRDYFIGLETNPSAVPDNPWFKDWYEQVNSCSLTLGSPNACVLKNRATLQNTFKQDPYVSSIIKAVFAYAKAFETLCPQGTRFCQAALQATSQDIQDALRSLDFTFPPSILGDSLTGQRIKFDAKGEILSADFSIFQYNNFGGGSFSFKEVAKSEDGKLTLNSNTIFYDQDRNNALLLPMTSLCGAAGCASCILPPNQVHFQYTPGDLVIASLVNAHAPSDSLFTCGPDLEKRLASIVAVQWAVGEYKRQNTDKLQGVSLGSLVADICPTGTVAASFLKSLFSSASSILDDKGLAITSRRNIYGFVDDTDNMMAKTISPILNQYKLPEIQAGATAMKSGDMNPYFARVVPSEEMYLKALTSLLQAKAWNHVQVVTMKNPYYMAMYMKFKAFAARHGICVVSTSYFDDGSSKVVSQLLSDTNAFVVITFGRASNIKEFFDEIKSTGNKGNLQIISGMAEWGTDPRYFDMATSEPEYTITLGLRQKKNNDFETYLRGLSQRDISANTFLTSLFEVTNKCSLVTATRGMYNRICSSTDTFAPYQGNAPYMIQAIYNMADSLHEIIADVCQNANYVGLCVEFQRLHDIPERLVRKVRNSNGISNGEGTTDIVYYVVSGGGYQEFGDYDTNGQHLNTVQGTNANLLNTRFNRGTTCPGSCQECQYMYTYKDIVYKPGDVIIAGSFSASSSGPLGLQPYVCGDIKTKNGPLLTMAMMYALDQVNNNKAPVSAKGLTFGGLALDHCGNEGRQKLMVSDIYSGFLHHSMDMEMDETKIISWLTAGSGAAKETASLLDPLGIPMVSPDATSESLLKDYSNFYRTIQGDVTIANAFVKIAKQLGFRYMQVVHSASNYGRNSKDTLVSVAQSEGVCVTQALELSDPTKASDIVQELLKKETDVVVIIMGTSSTEKMLEAITFNERARQSLVVMLPEPFKTSVDFYGKQMTYPPLALQLQRSTLAGFKAYLDSNPVNNVFFARYYMKLNRCNLEGYYLYSVKCSYPLTPITQNPQFVDTIFDLSTINAVYASVDAMDRTIKNYCGSDYTEPCAAFLQAPDQRQQYAKNLHFVNFIDEGFNAFRFLQREGNVAFNVMQYSKTKFEQIEVGSYAGVSLNLGSNFVNSYKDVDSACSLPCLECINRGLNFSLTRGDIYLGGLFDVHQRSFNPFVCGRINTLHGFLLLEAFHYALEQVNSNEGQFKNILKGVNLGGVGLDACSSQVRGGQLVSNINNNLTPLTKDAVTVEPSQIDVYLGSYDSSSTRYLARILTDLEIPQISYASGSTDLSDQRIYPYFYRTVPTNTHQARAILAYLNEMDIRYVQVLYAGNTYGRSGKEELVKLAAEYKICVAQTVEYADLGIASIERSKAAVSKLMEKPTANTVITFLGTSYINSILRAVGLSDRARGKLRFVGSDTWADNKDAIDGADSNAVDSITLKLDADDVVEFESYINSKTLANSVGNPWFEEYYQEIHNCYTTPGNPYGYTRRCPQSISSIISSGRYQQDANVITVMNSVYASAFAIHKTLTDLCGAGYQSVCQAYYNNRDRHTLITKNLADVEFKDPSGSDFKFTNREVQLNYRLNAIVSGQLQGVNYQQIGTYDPTTKKLNLTSLYQTARPWESGCDREDACTECPAIRDSTIRYTFYQSLSAPYDDAPVIVAFFDIHKQGVDPYRCGELNMAGFQQFLSFMYGVEKHFSTQIQGEQGTSSASHGIRILAVDTCSNPIRVDQDLFGLLQGTGLCNTNFQMPTGVSISAGNIGSVIVTGDVNTMGAARILEQLGITYISPNARSPLLDSKMHLARTLAPISADMRFLAYLAHYMDWYYFDVMYEDSEYGFNLHYSLQDFASDRGICVGKPIQVDGTNDVDVERFLGRLNGITGSKVVILLGSKEFFKLILNGASRLNIAEDYIWILANHEPMDKAFIESISPEDQIVNIITYHTKHHTLPGFRSYVDNLTYRNNDGDLNSGNVPKEWFEEFFQIMNDCTMSSANKVLNTSRPECPYGDSVSMNKYVEDPYILNTVLATYAASEGLSQLLTQNAAMASGKKLGASRMEIWKNILAANMKLNTIGVSSDDMFAFNSHRWWEPNYVVNYWKVDDKNAVLQTSTLKELPSLSNVDFLKENLNISSMCTESEKQGYCGCDYKSALTGAMVAAQDFVPNSHRNFYIHDDDGDRTYDWPVWAIIVAVLTGLGLFVTLILFLILLCAYPKKGGTSILGYLMIIGIIGIYAINFAFFMSATDTVCGIRRFFMGVVYTICFAPLLIKAVDNWRFGHMDYAQRRYSGISSACALLMCAIAVILIQCIIPIMWLILEHPKAKSIAFGDYRNDNDWCTPADDYDLGLVLSFSFVVFVVFMTGIFSALSYHTESNNYESRWILFASVATAGCFLVWMIVTTNAKGVYSDPAVAIANYANATILLLAIPMRKMILMIQAKRNKDEKESDNDKSPYDMYSESYVNPGYELSDYDQVFMEKPSEF